MKRNILRCCINWWSGANRPHWLRSALQRDPELVRYDSELRQMTQSLRGDALTWAGDSLSDDSSFDDTCTSLSSRETRHDSRHLAPTQPNSSDRRKIIAIGVTAATLALLLTAWHFSGSAFNTSKPDVVSKQQTFAAAELEINALLAVLEGSKSRVTGSVSSMPILVGNNAAIAANISSIRQTSRSSFETAARGYGQALSLIQRSARNQVIGEDSTINQLIRHAAE